MFIPNIKSLCTEQQQAYWLPKCADFSVVGCYAQTELGHGSNVRALETVATFVRGDGAGNPSYFDLHSPTLTATKFWPGTLGRTANHAMVVARLVDGDGVDRGVSNFIVPLRDVKTHQLLPGVLTGDIGPKIGYNNMDNGHCSFDHVKVPLENMPSRFATVDPITGKYRRVVTQNTESSSKVAYITMMQVRAMICQGASIGLAKACTIVIRYSAVRLQGYTDETNSTETSVLNYTQQQARVFPRLAAAYAFHFVGKSIAQRLLALEQDLGNTTKIAMTDVHSSSSALKSYLTIFAAEGIEDCRKACGGHGFLQSSGLPELATTYLQNCTVEGDNHMLPQQVVKVLLKIVMAVKMEEGVSDYADCDSFLVVPKLKLLCKGLTPPSCTAASASELVLSVSMLLDCFTHRAARTLFDVSKMLYEGTSWNAALLDMARVSRAYAQCLVLHTFAKAIAKEQGSGSSSPSLGPSESNTLSDLLRLLALNWTQEELGDWLEDKYLSLEQAQWIRPALRDVLDRVRPNAVALVDAWDYTDKQLKSVLGRSDGNVYNAIMDETKRDPLNATDPGPGYKEHLRKLIVGGVGKPRGPQSKL